VPPGPHALCARLPSQSLEYATASHGSVPGLVGRQQEFAYYWFLYQARTKLAERRVAMDDVQSPGTATVPGQNGGVNVNVLQTSDKRGRHTFPV
jgi:hypothetical protein